MPGRKRPADPRDGEGTGLDDLIDTLAALRAEVGELRSSLAGEVRTRRVILVEQDGFERLVAAARDGFAHVTLNGRTTDHRVTCVELFANDPIDGTGAHVGVALTQGDEVVATFETTADGPPRLWVAGEDEQSPD